MPHTTGHTTPRQSDPIFRTNICSFFLARAEMCSAFMIMFYSPDIVCDLACFVSCFACHFFSVSHSAFGFLCARSNSFSDQIKWLLSIILFCFSEIQFDADAHRVFLCFLQAFLRALPDQNAYILLLIVLCKRISNGFVDARRCISVCVLLSFYRCCFFVSLALPNENANVWMIPSLDKWMTTMKT